MPGQAVNLMFIYPFESKPTAWSNRIYELKYLFEKEKINQNYWSYLTSLLFYIKWCIFLKQKQVFVGDLAVYPFETRRSLEARWL
jgi:hypothetical protein